MFTVVGYNAQNQQASSQRRPTLREALDTAGKLIYAYHSVCIFNAHGRWIAELSEGGIPQELLPDAS